MRDGETVGRGPRRARRLRAVLVAAAAVAALALALIPLAAPPSEAATTPPSISVSPGSGRVNAIVTITLAGPWPADVGTTTRIPCQVTFLWNGAPWITTPVPGNAGQPATGVVPLTAPWA